MKIIYELPKTYKEYVRHQWEAVQTKYGLDRLDPRLIDAFKLAYQELLNDVTRVALFDSAVPVHVNKAIVDGLVTTAIEGFTAEECHELVTTAAEFVPEDEDGDFIQTVLAETALQFENEDDPDNYLEIHMLAASLITVTFCTVLENIIDDVGLVMSYTDREKYERMKRSGDINVSDIDGLSIGPDYSYVIVEVGKF